MKLRSAVAALVVVAISVPAWADTELSEHMPVEQWSNYKKKQRSLRTRSSSAGSFARGAPGGHWVGGPKPNISPASPPTVGFKSGYGRGTVVIDTSRRRLYYVLSSEQALSYPIAVGRLGFQWSGTKRISAVKNWPTWRPPAEMRQRQPKLPKVMSGGIYNPLGAKALYLGSSLYRIHGTANAKSIGTASSSGCFRMHNKHVVHLARLAGIGTRVIVMKRLPRAIARSIRGEPKRKKG